MDELAHDGISLGYMNKAYDSLLTEILSILKLTTEDSQEKLASIQAVVGEMLFDLKEKQDEDLPLCRNNNANDFFDLYKKVLPAGSYNLFNDLIKTVFDKIDEGRSKFFKDSSCLGAAKQLDCDAKKLLSDAVKAELDQIIDDTSKTVEDNFTKFKHLVRTVLGTFLDGTLDTDSKKTAKITMIMLDLMCPDTVESEKREDKKEQKIEPENNTVIVHASKGEVVKYTPCPVCCEEGCEEDDDTFGITTVYCIACNGSGKVQLFEAEIVD